MSHPEIPLNIFELTREEFLRLFGGLSGPFLRGKEQKGIPRVQYPIEWGNRTRPEIALTFDDGNDPRVVKQVLDLLEQREIKSTFFVVGRNLDASSTARKVWQRARDEGHQICNHTQNHRWLNTLRKEHIDAEIIGWENSARKIFGEEYIQQMKWNSPFLRLPGGAGRRDERVLGRIAELGYIPIGWSIDLYSVGRQLTRMGVSEVLFPRYVPLWTKGYEQNGAIILVHLNSMETRYLPQIIKSVEEKGLRMRTVSAILRP